MNNEDKILAMLEQLTVDVSGLKQDFSGLKQDVSGLKQDVSGLKQDVSGLKQDFSGLKQDVSGLKQDVSGLKQDFSGLKQDFSGLKQDFSGLKEKVDELDARSLRSAVALEGTVIPRLQLLYEGHETLLHKMDELTPKSRTDALEEEVIILRSAFHSLSQRLTALEQAR